MNGAGGAGGAGDALQQKRAAAESDEQRALKQMRTDATGSVDLAQTMFAGQPGHGNLFFMGSQPMQQPQSMMSLMGGIPTSLAQQQQQLQMQQRQHQYSAVMAARRNAQQQQAAAMAAMMGHQNVSTSMASQNVNVLPAAVPQGLQMQMRANPTPNIHVASLLAGQGVQHLIDTTSAVSMAQPPISSATAIGTESKALQPQQQQNNTTAVTTAAVQQPTDQQGNVNAEVPVTSNAKEESCLICGKKEDVFTCNGGCGLHVHPACVGENAIFPFVVGRLCGSCFIMQQNRVSPEDLTKGGTNALSVRRAILSANLETNDKRHFELIGHLASLRLGEIGSVAGYPIKPFAEKFIEPYLQRWIREKLLSVDKWMLRVREIFTVIIGLYSLKRACIAHSMREKVVELMEARKFTVTDYFGWHPAIEGPNVRCSQLCGVCGIRNPPELDICSRCHHKLAFPSVYSKYSGSILAAYYSEQLGIDLGATTLDVFSHTNTVRGMYKGLRPMDADGFLWDQFVDQLRMIFALLDVMSDFGTLQLKPDLFTPEINIIFNPAYVNQAMLNDELEVVGKFLQCMKLFGRVKSTENLNMITSCERFLIFKQLPDGGWCKLGRGKLDQYKSTVTCARALLTPEFRGCGPISHECQRLLEKWARGSNPKLPFGATTGAKQPSDASKLKLLASGAIVKPNAQANFKRLEAMYKRQTAPQGGNSSLEALMADRMKRLLMAKKLDEAENKSSMKEEAKVARNEHTAIKEEANPFTDEATSIKEKAISVKKEETGTGGTTDSEDSKLEHQATTQLEQLSAAQDGAADTAGEANVHDDEDYALTSMSLHEDLEIFDGLQFEDGGGIIDISFQSLGGHGEADIDVDDGDDADGTDAPGQEEEEDDTMGDNVYDDDQDENEDASTHAVDQELHTEPLNDNVEEQADNAPSSAGSGAAQIHPA